MDKYLDVISSRMAKERKRLGLEQTEVCKIVDISIPTLSRYENGKRSPDLVLSKRLSDLGYDVTYLITGKRLDESAGAPVLIFLINRSLSLIIYSIDS